ncbi:hypothetical protein PV326_009444 [Microctonus aethiopoides]|nr:hypothetical protein PV326_009444 [Microctonus aethiopoides]
MSVPNNFIFGEGANAPINNDTETQSISIPPQITLADIFALIKVTHKEQELKNSRFEAFMAASRDHDARPSRRSNSTSSHSSDESPSRQRRHHSHERRVSINSPSATSVTHSNAPQVLINPFGNNNSAPMPESDKQKLGPKNYLQSIPYFDGTLWGTTLKGEALRRAGKAQLRQIDDFTVFIRENFDTPRTYHTMREEINKLRQGVNEKMNAYITRVQELSTDLTEILRTEDIRDKETTKRVLNNDLINGFAHGLQHKYLHRFSTVSFLDLNSAFAEGRRVDKQLTVFPQLCPLSVIIVRETGTPYKNAEHDYTITKCERIVIDKSRNMDIRETPIRPNEPAQRLGPTTTTNIFNREPSENVIPVTPISVNKTQISSAESENIVRQRRDNVASSMDDEGRSGAAEKRNETGKIVCWNFGRSREGDTLVFAVEQDSGLSCRVGEHAG